jgi:benzoyl-CoA reductase/2-hydroxyglutaryl-CoA dehydratase subunit BcrC/BadD/HgdB
MQEVALKTNLIKKQAESYEKVYQRFKDDPKTQSDALYYKFLNQYYSNIIQARETSQPLGQHNLFGPVELFYAMDIVPYLQCHLSAVGPALWDCTEYFELAQGYGIAPEFCSFEKLRVGYMLADAITKPDFIVGSNLYCTASIKSMLMAAENWDIPYFIIDAPYSRDEAAIDYYGGQMKKAVAFMEDQTGRKMDYDRLRELTQKSKKCFDYFRQLVELRKLASSPVSFVNAAKANDMLGLGAGTDMVVEYLGKLLAEVHARQADGIPAVPGERLRIAWWGGIPGFDPKIIRWLAKDHGVNIVIDGFSLIGPLIETDEHLADPLKYIARKTLSFPVARFSGRFSDVSQDITRVARESKIDACIIYTSLGCTQISGIQKIYRDAISEKLGLPTFVLDGDYCDSRVVSAQQIRAKLEEFFSLLEYQKNQG